MIGWTFFYLLVFPGIAVHSCTWAFSWLGRSQVSARVQFRVGPRSSRNSMTFSNCSAKRRLSSAIAFTQSLCVAIGGFWWGTTLIAAMLGVVLFTVRIWRRFISGHVPADDLLGDVILGGSATGNVYSSLGAGREIKLLYLTNWLLFGLPGADHQIRLSDRLEEILNAQTADCLSVVFGSAAFIVGLLCIQAKMTLPPFHIPEAETEIVEGPLMEYSGPLLGFWKLNQAMQWVAFRFC
jgi:NADH-quinone oxidoreductase subunit H